MEYGCNMGETWIEYGCNMGVTLFRWVEYWWDMGGESEQNDQYCKKWKILDFLNLFFDIVKS